MKTPVLYYVPIIHSIEDYGSLGPAIAGAFVKKVGNAEFDRLQKTIHEYWKLIERRIEQAIGNVRGLIIYQDGFPAGEREKVLKLFEYMQSDHPESPNFRLVKKLLAQGAILEGTEDPHLLIEQLRLYQRAVEVSSPDKQESILAAGAARSRELVRIRDKSIAKRIRDTLPASGRGILFIGRDHDVISELEKSPEKFTVISL
ncbi:MAG: hypothetical protein AAB537_01205 [Patescibacteria group bacterium]